MPRAFAFVLALAAGGFPGVAQTQTEVPQIVPAPACVTLEELAAGEIERLYRFAAVPAGFEIWQRQNCYPLRLDDSSLASTANPVGTVVTVAGHDALVIDPGSGWLGECAASGVPASGAMEVSGAELLGALERIAGTPGLAEADIREIGLGKGRQARGGEPIYALIVGTPRSLVRIQCFESVAAIIDRAATAMREAERN